MTFTKDQMETLKPFEENFKTAIDAKWARNPGRANLQVIHGVFTIATGDNRRLDSNCQHCIVTLLRDCGRIYFKDKESLEKAEAAAKEVKAEDVPAKPKKKVSVKTKK